MDFLESSSGVLLLFPVAFDSVRMDGMSHQGGIMVE